MVLGLLLSGNAYAGQKIIYLGGSSWKMDDGKNKDFTFFEGGSCEYSYINLWRSTYKDCQWQQEGPKVKIIINNGYYIIDGYISGQNFKGRTISKSHGTGTIRGYVEYHEKVYKNWISPEEKQRIADEKKRQERQKELERKAKEYEKKKYSLIGYKGKQVRDNLHSKDLTNCFWEFYKKPKKGKVYNVGGGRFSNCSIIEAINIFEKLTSFEVKRKIIKKPRVGDHIWYITNMKRFKNDYPNWKQNYNTQKIIEELINN